MSDSTASNDNIIHIHADDALAFCSLEDLCRRTRLDEGFVIECVEHGVAHVAGGEIVAWRFSITAILRLQKAWRLHRDLELQVGSLALVLDLLEERDQLLQEIADLRGRLGQWEV
jgi:chaperone modulatory protein CbpM